MALSLPPRTAIRVLVLVLFFVVGGLTLVRIRLAADVLGLAENQPCPEDVAPVVAKLTSSALQIYNASGSEITRQPVSVRRYRSVKLGDGSISYERRVFQDPRLEEFYGVYTMSKSVDSANYPLLRTPFDDSESPGKIFPLVGKTWQEKEVIDISRLQSGDPSQLSLAIKPITSSPACYSPDGSSLSLEQILQEGVEVILSDSFVEGSIIPVDYEQHGSKYDAVGNRVAPGPVWPLGAGVTATINGESVPLRPFTLEPRGRYWWLGKVARPKGKVEASIEETARYSKGWGEAEFARTPDQPAKTVLELAPVKENVTFYVTIYRPGEGGIEGGCIGQQDIKFYSRQPDGTVIDGCSHQAADTIGTQHLDHFYPGGIAVNHPASGFAAFPLPDNIKGQGTWWIQLPGYSDGPVPVVDTFAVGQSNLHKSVNGGKNGEDYRYRLDLAVQNSAQEQELREKLRAAGATDASDFGAITVPGSSVFFGYVTSYSPTSKLNATRPDSHVAIKYMDGTNLGWWSNGWRPDDSMMVSGFDTWHSRNILFPSEAALQGQDIEVVVPITDRFPSCSTGLADPDSCSGLQAKSAFGVFAAPGPWHDVGSGLFNGMNRQFSPVSPAEAGSFPYYQDMLGSFVVDYSQPDQKVTVKLNFGGMPLELRRRVYMWGAIVAKINPMAVMYSASLADEGFNHTYNDLILLPSVAYNNPNTPKPIEMSEGTPTPPIPLEPPTTPGATQEPPPPGEPAKNNQGEVEIKPSETTPKVTVDNPAPSPAIIPAPEPVNLAVRAAEAVTAFVDNSYQAVKEAVTAPSTKEVTPPQEPEPVDDVGTAAIKRLSARVATLDLELQSIKAQMDEVNSDQQLSRREKYSSRRTLNQKKTLAARTRRTATRNLALAQRYYRQYQATAQRLDQLKANPPASGNNWRSRRAYNSWRTAVRRQETTLRTLTRNLTRLGA